MGRKKTAERAKLDYYIKFLENSNGADLTNDQLNEIIYMHGFRRLHRRPKKLLIEAVDSIDLLVPYRSTLSELGSSSSAFLSLEELMQDLRLLQWHECSVQSVETLGWVQEEKLLRKNGNVFPFVGENLAKWGSKRKRRRSGKVNTIGVASCSALTAPPDSSCASHRSFKRGW